MRTFFHLQKSDTVYQAKFCKFGNMFMICVFNMNIARIKELCLDIIGCRGVKLLLLKDCLKFCHKLSIQNLNFWVVSQSEFGFGCYLTFLVLLVFEFCPNLSFVRPFFLRFVTLWIDWILFVFKFMSFVKKSQGGGGPPLCKTIKLFRLGYGGYNPDKI